MAPGSRTPPFPAPGSGHAAAVRPGPNGLTGSPRAVPRASGVCGAIGGAGGRGAGAGAGKGPARRAAPRGGGTLWPPSSPPPPPCKFRSPGRRVSLTSFSCVQREREWAGPRQTSFSGNDCLDAARTLLGAASGRMGAREGSGKPGNLCTLAKFCRLVWSSGSAVVRRCFNASRREKSDCLVGRSYKLNIGYLWVLPSHPLFNQQILLIFKVSLQVLADTTTFSNKACVTRFSSFISPTL